MRGILGRSSGGSDILLSPMNTYSRGVGGLHRDTHKGENGGRIQFMGTSNFLSSVKLGCLVFQIVLIREKTIPFPHEYIFIKSYTLDSISCTELVRVI